MNPRVLFCRSNPVAPDPRVEKEVQALAAADWRVQVVAWDRSGKLKRTEPLGNAIIQRLGIQAQYASGMQNLPALTRWQWALLGWLIRQRHTYDIIHACDFDTVIPALICKYLFRKQVVYDIFDFYADHLRATPAVIKRLIRFFDLAAINAADALILVDETRHAQIRGARPRRCVVIYNSPLDVRDDLARQFPPPAGSKLHLAYIGLLQIERGLFEMLEILQQRPDWSLDLAGFGGDEAQLAAQAEKLSNVRFYGRVPYQHALQMSAAADVLFATYDPAIPNHRFSSPNKVFEAMMLGKPIIVARHTNMDRLITAEKCGLVVPYGDKEALLQALQQLQTDEQLRHHLGYNGRRAYEEKYSWGIMERRLLDLYQSLHEHQ